MYSRSSRRYTFFQFHIIIIIVKSLQNTLKGEGNCNFPTGKSNRTSNKFSFHPYIYFTVSIFWISLNEMKKYSSLNVYSFIA